MRSGEGVRPDPIVRLTGVTVRAADGSLLLDDVSLEVNRGECVLLCGRSGMGKTTVTKCVNGLIPQFEPALELEGTVSVCGYDPATCEMYELAGHVGSVFQNPKSQFFNLTSNDELAFGLEAAGVPADVIEERMAKTVRALHAESLLNRNVTTMSGGEKQSLVFASVDVMSPEVYVLDEPTANLDERAVRLLHDQIAALVAQGKTVIVAEHRLHFIADLIDRAVLVERGRVVREFTPEEFRALAPGERERLGLRVTNAEELADLRKHAVDDAGDKAVRLVDACVGEEEASRVCNREMGDGKGEAERGSSARGGGLALSGFTCVRAHKEVFARVNLEVPRGRVVGIVGANGTGKSTLLRSIAGLERKTSGSVALDGEVLDARDRRRVCAMVMQDVNHQLFCDSVQAECELAAGAGEGVARRIGEVLASLDLAELAERHPMSLSGGQKQRVAVACALLAGRDVILLDEPTSGLDLRHMIEVSNLVRGLASRGLAVVVATHDREFLSRACDEVYELTASHARES